MRVGSKDPPLRCVNEGNSISFAQMIGLIYVNHNVPIQSPELWKCDEIPSCFTTALEADAFHGVGRLFDVVL